MANPAMHEERIRKLPVSSKRLWVGVLAAPAGWLLLELVGYYLAARSCEPGASGIPLGGTSNARVTQVAIAIVAIVIALIGLVTAIGNWRALPQPGREPPAELGRAQFMAFVGVLTSVLFLGGIVLFGIPPFLVNACSQAR